MVVLIDLFLFQVYFIKQILKGTLINAIFGSFNVSLSCINKLACKSPQGKFMLVWKNETELCEDIQK